MVENPYQYVLELYKEDGAKLGQMAVEVDFEPAREWTRFCALRRSDLSPADAGAAAAICPLWHSTVGAPYLRGFRVRITGNGSAEVARDFLVSYFRNLAQQASSYFVERGKLKEGEHFHYFVTAYPRAREPEGTPDFRFTAKEAELAMPLVTSVLSEFLKRAVPAGTVDAEDMPVFIPLQVLNEIVALARAADGKETGGILIGHLRRDPELPEIFAEITAQILAEARGETMKLSFTPATWTAAEAAIRLRNRNELYLGYWHSHPVREWCKQKECPVEKQRDCNLAVGFFSADDQALLRAVFPRAYSVGLVATDAPFHEVTHSLFGWRQGVIERRGFYIVGGDNAA